MTQIDAEKYAVVSPHLALFWRLVRPHLADGLVNKGNAFVNEAYKKGKPLAKAEEMLIRHLTDDRLSLPFKVGALSFLTHFDLATQLDEIFVRQQYKLSFARKLPRMIDAGANIGLASIYMKMRHPDAQIVAFEPNPAAAAAFRANMDAFDLKDVELIEAAVGSEDGEATLFICPVMPMASSVSHRMAESGYEVEPQIVQIKALTPYLMDPVDFLKIDIEGAEYSMLSSVEPIIRQANHIFCEFHFQLAGAKNLVTNALAIFDRAGYDWMIASAKGVLTQPFTIPAAEMGGWSSSLNFWARARDASPAGSGRQ